MTKFLSEVEKSAIAARAAITGYNRRIAAQQSNRSKTPAETSPALLSGASTLISTSKAARTAAAVAVEADKSKTKALYLSIIQHSCQRWLFVRYNDKNEDFCQFLVENVRAKTSNCTIGRRFFDASDVDFLAKNVAPTHGWKPTIYELSCAQWSPQQWLSVNCSAAALLDALCNEKSSGTKAPSSNKRKRSTLESSESSATDDDQVAKQMRARRKQRLAHHFNDYCTDYSQFSRWMINLLDNFRDQLFPRVLFVVFQHCYFDLVMLGSTEHAVQFYDRFQYQFSEFNCFEHELLETRKVLTADHMMENEACRRLRIKANETLPTYPIRNLDAVSRSLVLEPQRVRFGVTQDCFQFLMHNSRFMMPPKIANVLRTYVDFYIQ